ncbi:MULTISPECIES: MarR family winged helix-turn-helix transcriptional regulator [Nonomuraea]|uniref:MarR family winged helix-turn-helix transcriptional regulator n=1 Tax=Nonomuraea salmonea TaxID=46181 RepID=A0ABV5P421_9ACTN
MNTPEGPPAERLRRLPTRLTNGAALIANRLVDQALAGAGARRYHYALLATLEEFGPASQAELGRRTGIDRSDVVAAVNDLADQGFLQRAPDPGDRRRNVITITPAGRKQLADLDRLLTAAQDDYLAPLSATDRRTFVDLLTRLTEHHSGR